MKRVAWITGLLCLALLPGCSRKPAEEALADKSATEVMEQAAKDTFTPPADGRLNDKQIEMYIAVKKREAELGQAVGEKLKKTGEKIEKQGEGVRSTIDAFRAMGDVANFLTTDIRAAQELGYNTEEYQWVQSQILSANAALSVSKMTAGMQDMLEKQLVDLRAARSKESDSSLAQTYDAQIQSLEQSLAQTKAEQWKDAGPGLEHNAQLLEKYKDRLNVLEAEIKKWKALEGEKKGGDQ